MYQLCLQVIYVPQDSFILLVYVMNKFSPTVNKYFENLSNEMKCGILYQCECCSVMKLLLRVTSKSALLAHCTHPRANTSCSLCCLAIDGE
jgi:hypothetical protein